MSIVHATREDFLLNVIVFLAGGATAGKITNNLEIISSVGLGRRSRCSDKALAGAVAANVHYTLHTGQCIQHTEHYSLHSLHAACGLKSAHFTSCILQNVPCLAQCTLHHAHRMLHAHWTLYITLYRMHLCISQLEISTVEWTLSTACCIADHHLWLRSLMAYTLIKCIQMQVNAPIQGIKLKSKVHRFKKQKGLCNFQW